MGRNARTATADTITLAWLKWNAHCPQWSFVRNPMKDHAGNTTRDRSARVRQNADSGLTTRGTVGVALLVGVVLLGVVLLLASGALMPFMLANRPHNPRVNPLIRVWALKFAR